MPSDIKSPAGTFRRYIEERQPAIFKNYFGSRFVGALGLVVDAAATAQIDAWKAFLQKRVDGPSYDALNILGSETSIPQLAREDWLTYENRLQDPWETWSYAGSEDCLTEQLTQSIFTDAEVIRYYGNGSDSEFIVFFPTGSHPVTAPPAEVGSFVVGDGTLLGPVGLDPEEMESLRAMIRHWKPVLHKCPYAIFQLSGWVVGTENVQTIGSPGLVIGGETTRAQIQI